MVLIHKQEKSMRLGTYPYTYVRTAVMRAKLFRKADYHKMLKMDFNQIAQTLQESHYQTDINAFATRFSGAELLEHALMHNLASSFKKLVRISPGNLGMVINEYLKRKDVEDIKVILRGITSKTDPEFIASKLSYAGTLRKEHIDSLIKLDSVEDILKNNGLVPFTALQQAYASYQETKKLYAIENALDNYYYRQLLVFSQRLPKQGVHFRNYIRREAEVLNILTVLRLKQVGQQASAISGALILSDLSRKLVQQLVDAADLQSAFSLLEKTKYADIIKRGVEEYNTSTSLITLEADLFTYLLMQSILKTHQRPLSVDMILGYMFAKDLEVRNLNILLKGKQLGLEESFIEQHVIST